MVKFAWIAALVVAGVHASPQPELGGRATSAQTILPSNSHIWYHGRWDTVPSSWWSVIFSLCSSRAVQELTCTHRPGSGFKLAFAKAPSSMTINVGNSVSTPPIPVSVRFGDSGEWVTLNLTAGANAIPLTSVGLIAPKLAKYPITFDVRTQFEDANERLELESIVLDGVSSLLAPWLDSR
jgi:hypothetical protein